MMMMLKVLLGNLEFLLGKVVVTNKIETLYDYMGLERAILSHREES